MQRAVHGALRIACVITVAGFAAVVFPISTAFAQNPCPGDCPLDRNWGGVSEGAYRFDSTVENDYPEIMPATFQGDDGWGAFYHDQNNPNAITIKVDWTMSGEEGGAAYIRSSNTILIDPTVAVGLGSSPYMISVMAHEFGHSLGFGDLSECGTSIMSYQRDRGQVLGPSSEDLCWYYWDPWSGGGDDC